MNACCEAMRQQLNHKCEQHGDGPKEIYDGGNLEG